MAVDDPKNRDHKNPKQPEPKIAPEVKTPEAKPAVTGWFKEHAVEMVGVLVVGIYTCVNYNQLGATQDANRIASETLTSTQRAYLSEGDIERTPAGIKIHILNFGHAQAKILSGSLMYSRVAVPQNILLDRRESPVPPDEISPGQASEFVLVVDLPKLSPEDQVAVSAVSQLLAIDGSLTFDTGFHTADKLHILGAFEPKENRWTHINAGVRVDLPNAPNTAQERNK